MKLTEAFDLSLPCTTGYRHDRLFDELKAVGWGTGNIVQNCLGPIVYEYMIARRRNRDWEVLTEASLIR